MAQFRQDLEKAIKAIKLEIDAKEQEELNRELNTLMLWLEPMLEVGTAETGEVLYSHGAVNVLREDFAWQGSLAELQEAAPDFADGFYLVPPIIE